MPHVRQVPQLHTGIILRASASEWRIGERLPAHTCEQWQLVFVLDGMVEETTDGRPLRLRAGRVLFHQPSESYTMQAVGDVPPEVLRVEFEAAGNILDAFRGCMTRAAPPESAALRQLAAAVREGWQVEADGVRLPEPVHRPEPPLGCVRLQQLYLEQALWLMARRLLRGGRRPSPRVRAEQNQNALVEAARLYMAEHIETTVPLSELCRAAGCGRAALQAAFRARTGHTPREYNARLRAEHAGALLAQGYTPGEVARMLGYSSPAYFSQRFRALTGRTPTAYRRDPTPLHLCNK